MTRTSLAANNLAESQKPSVNMIGMADIAFPSGTIYVTSAGVPISYSGNRYAPSGLFGGADGLTEAADLKARQVNIKMSGLDSSLIAKIIDDAYHFAVVNLYLGFCDENWRLVADPHQIGGDLLLSDALITLDSGSGIVELNVEPDDVLNLRTSAQLATPEAQKLRYPGDTGLDDMRAIVEAEVEWGGRRWPSGTGGPSHITGRIDALFQ